MRNDAQCLEQAALVAQTRVIDLDEVGRWSKVEGKIDDFSRIKHRLAGRET
jgi:hypothetical protein